VIDRPDQLEVGDVRSTPRGTRSGPWFDRRIAAKGFELLEFLLMNAGRVLTRRHAHRSHLGPELLRRHEDPRRPHQSACAAKVESDPATPTRIVTVRGVGYRYEKARV